MWIQAPFPLLPSQGWRRVVSICSVAVLHAWLPGIVRGSDLGGEGLCLTIERAPLVAGAPAGLAPPRPA